MFSRGRSRAVLRVLGRKVPLDALPHVQPVFFLQMLLGLSQIFNGDAVQPETLARALILDGQQRLRKLREAAPHLDLSLAHLWSRLRASETPEECFSDEESAVQAMIEMCLGLMLRWLSQGDPESSRPADSVVAKHSSSSHVLLPSYTYPFYLLFRARSCLIA